VIRAYLELFAGGAACALALQGGPSCVPPVGYMGGKRKLASAILGAAGLRTGERAERVLLCDAGLWGEVWHQVVADAPGLAARLIAWEGRDPSELWRSLAMAPRPEDPQERAAAYLWLQGRTANNSPVWWEGDGEIRMTHRNGIGGPCEQHQPAALERPARVLPRTGRLSSGVTRPRTVSDRILAAGRALAGARVDRQHPDPHEVSSWLGTPGDLSGVVVMLDPPYVGATRYEATCPRADVVALARDFKALGATVIVCEAEALPELLTLGWHGLDLRAGAAGKPEWLTCSEPPHHLARPQLALFGAA